MKPYSQIIREAVRSGLEIRFRYSDEFNELIVDVMDRKSPATTASRAVSSTEEEYSRIDPLQAALSYAVDLVQNERR